MAEQLEPDAGAVRSFEPQREAYLLGRIAAGDREAFAQLFDQHAATVL